MTDINTLKEQSKLIRYLILEATTEAGSGHPTSSLSAVELMVGLLFGRDKQGDGFFHFDAGNRENPNNDRLLFSKGHASPLFYSLWAAAGQVSFDDMLSYRNFNSPLEGHPTRRFPFTEAATGSLGQGLSIGLGLALNGKYLDKLPYRTFVLLGDSEMAEGSQWEAVQLAAHYRLDNLIGVLDVNRLGQRGETMYGHDIQAYADRLESFGWNIQRVNDGHDLEEVISAYEAVIRNTQGNGPSMIIARTIKGKGVSLLEDKNGWHGKALSKEQYREALEELGEIKKEPCDCLAVPENKKPAAAARHPVEETVYTPGDEVATRNAYGEALALLGSEMEDLVVLDGEVSNSTKAQKFKEDFPDRFFEMFIAEQNMAGVALGLDLRGKTVFSSSFAAFLTRACDQIRMARVSDSRIKICGSHAGVSIGQDGPSQMGLEDLAFFRTILDCAVLYPADGVAAKKLVYEAAQYKGMAYLRTTRGKTPVIYENTEAFPIGGSKVLRISDEDLLTIVAAGITLHEALAAADSLADTGIKVRVIDVYSVKPLDIQTLLTAARETGRIVTVEDHFAEGGIGEAVLSAIATSPCPVHKLAVTRKPRSGKPGELLDYEGISQKAIEQMCRKVIDSTHQEGKGI